MPDLSSLRTLPRPRAQALARGLLSLLDFRPDLRRMYSVADLALIEHLAGVGEPERVSPTLYAKAANEPYKFSSTQINIADADPKLDKQLLAMAAEIPDKELADDGREDRMHVTVKYGLHTQDPEDVCKLLEDFGPIRITLGSVSIFPANGDKEFDVVKVDVSGDDLVRLNHFVSKRLECTDTHPEYKPHITLAYVKAGAGEKYVGDDRFKDAKIVSRKMVFSNKAKEKTAIVLAMPDDLPNLYAKSVDDQPRDSLGRWTVEGRADLDRASKDLARYRDVPLDHDDLMAAVNLWQWLQADHGEFSENAIEELAKEATAAEKRAAMVAWMIDRAGRERRR